jgi:hypothetical protein
MLISTLSPHSQQQQQLAIWLAKMRLTQLVTALFDSDIIHAV